MSWNADQVLVKGRDPIAGEEHPIYEINNSLLVSESHYFSDTALGRRPGRVLWNKFGFNTDIDIGTEVVADFGATVATPTITIYTTASTWTLSSSSTNDDTDSGTGCQSVILYGVDENWASTIEVLALQGTTPVVSTTSWVSYPNRIAMYLCGTGQVNDGNITCTRTTGGAVVGYIEAGTGVTNQCIFTVEDNAQFMAKYLKLNAVRAVSGSNPHILFKFWVYSSVSNGKQEVYRHRMDTNVELSWSEDVELPFPIGERSICWIEVTTDQNNTIANCRFSGILVQDSAV